MIDERGGITLRERSPASPNLCQNLKKIALREQLKSHVNKVIIFEEVEHSHDVGMADSLKNGKLLLEQRCHHFILLHLLLLDDFERAGLVRAQMRRFVNFAEYSSADHLLKSVELLDIFNFVEAFESAAEREHTVV